MFSLRLLGGLNLEGPSGDLAALVGDTAGAIDAYTRYLNLRTDPDPELRPQVDSVRMALERLQRAKE